MTNTQAGPTDLTAVVQEKYGEAARRVLEAGTAASC